MAISMMACKGTSAGLAAERSLANPTIGSTLGLQAASSGQFIRGLGGLKSRLGLRSVQPSSGSFLGTLRASCRRNGVEECATLGLRWNANKGRGLRSGNGSFVCTAAAAETNGEAEDEPQRSSGKPAVNVLHRIAVRSVLFWPLSLARKGFNALDLAWV